jgi:hypothetical protein
MAPQSLLDQMRFRSDSSNCHSMPHRDGGYQTTRDSHQTPIVTKLVKSGAKLPKTGSFCPPMSKFVLGCHKLSVGRR